MASPGAGLTLADIARLAGVGLATASRALNDAPGVAPATRQRVLEVARQNSYVVSPEAARLAGGSTGRVALVVPHIDRWFFGAMVAAMEPVFRAANLDTLLYPMGALHDRQYFFDQLPVRRKVDAVMVVAFPVMEEEQRRLESLGVQIAAAGGQAAMYPHVRIDDESAGRQAMDHLIHLGHQRIAMIEAVDPDQREQPSGRSAAYHAALADAGLESGGLVVSTDWGGEQGAEAMGDLLAVRRPPTAVFAHSDEVALGAIRTIRRAGLRVPGDISVIGIDDHPLASLTDLTTVRQPVAEQGVEAARMLLRLMRGEELESEQVTLPTRLVVRATTGRAARR